MESWDFITSLEGKLKAAIHLEQRNAEAATWLLSIKLLYDGEPAGNLSFNLDGYAAEEALSVARNVPNNAYMMREIDEYLWGESD